MDHVYIEKINQHVGQEISIKGWLYNKTAKGKLRFLLIRDGTGIIQAVAVQKDLSPGMFESLDKVFTCTPGDSHKGQGGILTARAGEAGTIHNQ